MTYPLLMLFFLLFLLGSVLSGVTSSSAMQGGTGGARGVDSS